MAELVHEQKEQSLGMHEPRNYLIEKHVIK